MENEQKLKNSRGEIYNSCPFIDDIICELHILCESNIQNKSFNLIKKNLEIIREINRELRNLKDETNIRSKYDIVNMYLNIDSENLKFIESGLKDIAYKLERLEDLEKENEELKQEINNLTNKK